MTWCGVSFRLIHLGFIFRAYHARAAGIQVPPPDAYQVRSTSTEAIYIFHNMVRRLIAKEKPE